MIGFILVGNKGLAMNEEGSVLSFLRNSPAENIATQIAVNINTMLAEKTDVYYCLPEQLIQLLQKEGVHESLLSVPPSPFPSN